MTLRDIHENVTGLGHVDYPLLDPLYSPGSAMPVVDFSPTIKDLVLADDWSTIHDFVAELGHDSHLAEATVRTFREFPINKYLSGSRELLAEIVAILILIHRIPHTGHPDNNYWLLTRFIQNTLCCGNAQIADAARPLLLERLREDVAKQRHETKRTDIRDPSVRDLEVLDDEPPQSIACQRLAEIPVTSRMVVFDAMTRNWGHSTIRRLRPELYYGERQFGNNVEWNLHYVGWTDIFVAPPSDTDLTKLLSKDAIRSRADRHSISIPKSYSRSRMLERVQDKSQDAYQALFREATKGSAIVDPSIESALNEVLHRWTRIEYACRALAAM